MRLALDLLRLLVYCLVAGVVVVALDRLLFPRDGFGGFGRGGDDPPRSPEPPDRARPTVEPNRLERFQSRN